MVNKQQLFWYFSHYETQGIHLHIDTSSNKPTENIKEGKLHLLMMSSAILKKKQKDLPTIAFTSKGSKRTSHGKRLSCQDILQHLCSIS